MRGHHQHPRLRGATIVIAILLAGCSASSGSDTRTEDPVRKANRSYLVRIGYGTDQATCVSRRVSVDLEKLLSASDSSDQPTENAGFEQFAAASRRCIEQDTELTTTTAPPD